MMNKKKCPCCEFEGSDLARHARYMWGHRPDDYEHLKLAIKLNPVIAQHLIQEIEMGNFEGGQSERREAGQSERGEGDQNERREKLEGSAPRSLDEFLEALR